MNRSTPAPSSSLPRLARRPRPWSHSPPLRPSPSPFPCPVSPVAVPLRPSPARPCARRRSPGPGPGRRALARRRSCPRPSRQRRPAPSAFRFCPAICNCINRTILTAINMGKPRKTCTQLSRFMLVQTKSLQTKDMLIDVAIEKVQGLISFFEGYRETGFLLALEIAKGIAQELDIDAKFPERREIKRKKQFDENPDDTNVATHSAEESFRINCFIPLVDQAISSLKTRFEQYEGYQKIFGFLFTSEKMLSLDDASLKSSCHNLEAALMEKETSSDANEYRKSDIDANELYVELKLLRDFIPKGNMGPVEVLSFLKRHDCFPNASIAYRVLLTIPVTVASAERSFSKLKLLKSYMRTTMTQQRLNDLATISLESEVLENIGYEDIIEDFISKNPQRMMLFK